MIAGRLEIQLYADMARLERDMNNATGMVSRKMEQAAKDIGKLGLAAVAAGSAMAAAFVPVVKSFADLEVANAKMQASMSTDKGVSKNFEKIKSLAVELGNLMPGTTADFADMFTALSRLGVTEESILGGVGKAAANLAVVMKLPYEEAAEVVGKLKKVTGVADADMLKFMDTIQRTANQGVKATEMMYAFARAGGALSQYGIQGEDQARKMAVIYAQLISAGASGETVGSGFATIMRSLLAFTNSSTVGAKRATEQLEGLQIQLEFFENGKFKGVDNLIQQFDKLKNLSQTDMGELLNNMFGGGQDASFVAQLINAGVEGNKKMADSMAAQASLTEKSAIQLDTLTAKWESATGTFTNLLAAIGETFAPQLKIVVDLFGSMAEKAGALVRDHKELFGWLGLGAAGTAVALVGTGALALTISGTVLAIGTISSAITGLSVLLAANPMVMTILGIGAVGAAGFAAGTRLKEDIDWLINKIGGTKGNTLGGAIYDLTTSIGKSYDGFIKFFSEFPKTITKSLSDGIATVKATVKEWEKLGVDIVMGMWKGIKDTAKKPLEAIKELAESLPEWARKLLKIQSPSKVFEEIGGHIGDGLAKGIEGTTPAVSDAAKKLVEAAIVPPQLWKSLLTNLDSNFNTTFLRMIETGKGGWKTFTTSLANTFKTTVADFIYKQLAKPFVLQLVMSLAGVTGATGLAAAAGNELASMGSPSGSTTSWMSILKGGYDALSGGFKAFGQMVANGAHSAGASAATAGQIGAASSYIGAGLAGVTIGTFIAGDKTLLGMNGMTTSVLGAALSAALLPGLGPIGLFIGGIAGGALNALFGRGPKEYGTTTVRGGFSGEGFAGNMVTPWTQKGGVFRSNKSGEDITPLEEQAQQFLNSFVGKSGASFARLITLSGDAARSVEGWNFEINRALTTEEDMTKLFGDMADSMGTHVIPELEKFRAKGENLADTAVRMGDEYIITDSIFKMMGFTAAATGIASLGMRDSLIQLMGGIQATSATMDSYYKNYFTADEQQANSLRQVNDSFKLLGVQVPKTRAEFRAMADVLVQDTTPAGQELFAAFMKLNPAFAAVTKSTEDLAAAAIESAQQMKSSLISSLDTLHGNNALARMEAQSKQDDAMAALSESAPWIKDLGQLSTITIDDFNQYSNANKLLITNALSAGAALKQLSPAASGAGADLVAYRNQVRSSGPGVSNGVSNIVSGGESDQGNIFDAAQKMVQAERDKLKSLSDSLKQSLNSLRAPLGRAQAQAQIMTALAIAKASGILPSADSLSRALEAIKTPSEKLFSTFVEWQTDQIMTANTVAELSSITDTQLTVADQTLKI